MLKSCAIATRNRCENRFKNSSKSKQGKMLITIYGLCVVTGRLEKEVAQGVDTASQVLAIRVAIQFGEHVKNAFAISGAKASDVKTRFLGGRRCASLANGSLHDEA